MIRVSESPPPRYDTPAASRVAEMRARIGQTASVRDWQRAVSIRDPVSTMKRHRSHVNRATFKLHEISARLLGGSAEGGGKRRVFRRAAFLAEAPGGFLFCARQAWPQCECHAMSSTAPSAIAFANPDEQAIARDLPYDSDVRVGQVEDELVRRWGKASFDLVSADGGTDIQDLDAAEQCSTALVLAQAAIALRLQSQGGCLVLKILEGCTQPTRQLFEVVRSLYERTMLFKPLSSKMCNSERYIVATNLQSAVHAERAAQLLRTAVDLCNVGRPDARFVACLGVEVSEMTHCAFDHMASEQADAIRTVLQSIERGRVGDLRTLAVAEAKQIEECLRTLVYR